MTQTTTTGEDIAIIVRAFRRAMGEMTKLIDFDLLNEKTKKNIDPEILCQFTFTSAVQTELFGDNPDNWPKTMDERVTRLLVAAAFLIEGNSPPVGIDNLSPPATLDAIMGIDEPGEVETESLFLVKKDKTGKQYDLGHEAHGFPVVTSITTGKTATIPWTFLIDLAIAAGVDDDPGPEVAA